ncbi:hypothetical protein [Porphyrobacter sp. YT40]|uniref:hypothetical protein n=1 Tax=Porphyrobacter sp. YT40 TaxID=2547601 RepID=UPI0011428670|nr:hypothetical protein [Porphyrobacter sp. YT40]QDH32917.1 hypothetical protein E2E27_00300 [Porphyrobacter sp. YT40]
MLIPLFAAALALQDAPPQAAQQPPAETVTIDELPVADAAAARCAVAYATIGQWQKAGDPRGAGYPEVTASGGREFFVRVMAQLMDTGLTRDNIVTIAAKGVESNNGPDGEQRVAQLMPACELMKSAAGL